VQIRRRGQCEDIAAQHTNVIFDKMTVDQPGTAKADINLRNDEGGGLLSTDGGRVTLSDTDSVGVVDGHIIGRDGFYNILYKPGSTEGAIRVGEGGVVQQWDGVSWRLLALEGTPASFLDVSIDNQLLLINSGSPTRRSIIQKNPSSVRDELTLLGSTSSALGAFCNIYGSLDSTNPNEIRMGFGGNSTPDLIIDGDESQKVKRGGVFEPIIAESDIVNNTTSTSTTEPLAANQGKVLQDQINSLVVAAPASWLIPVGQLGGFTLAVSDIGDMRSMLTPGASAAFTCTIPASDGAISVGSLFGVYGKGGLSWTLDYTGVQLRGHGLLATDFSSTQSFSDLSWLVLQKTGSNEWEIISWSYDLN